MRSGGREVWENWFGKSLANLVLSSTHLRPLHKSDGQPAATARRGIPGSSTLCKTLGADSQDLIMDVTKHRHTAGCGVVTSLYPKFLSREQRYPEAEEKAEAPDCPREEWILGLCCQLPSIVWCAVALIPPPPSSFSE